MSVTGSDAARLAQPLVADDERYVLPGDSAPLTDAEYALSARIVDWIGHLIESRERYIATHRLDRSVNHPAANWLADHEVFSSYRAIRNMDRQTLQVLRLFTMSFSGSYMGLTLAEGLPTPRAVPENFDALVQARLDELAAGPTPWWSKRYAKLMETYPEFGRLSLPQAFGESGFRCDDVILNHDLFVYLERLALLKASGVFDEISGSRRAVLLEIGSGFGALAYLLRNVVPNSTYICVDLPESLYFSAIYLSRFFPNVHFADERTDWSTLTQYDFVFVPNYMFHRLAKSRLRVDLGINTLSMSEMTEPQVRAYCIGLAGMLGGRGAFFEQNQDNRHLGLCNARDTIRQIFPTEQPLALPEMDLTHGVATLWRASPFRRKLSRLIG